MRAVHQSLAHPRVALVEARDQLRVLHVGDVGLVAGLAVERLVAGQAGGGHAHAGDTDPAQAVGRNHDGVHLVADVHDPRRLVAETLGETGEHVAALDDMRVGRDRFHGAPPHRTTDSILHARSSHIG